MVNQQGTRIDTRPSSSGPIVPFAEADLTILTRSLLGYQLWTTAQVAHTSGVSTPTSMATTNEDLEDASTSLRWSSDSLGPMLASRVLASSSRVALSCYHNADVLWSQSTLQV